MHHIYEREHLSLQFEAGLHGKQLKARQSSVETAPLSKENEDRINRQKQISFDEMMRGRFGRQ